MSQLLRGALTAAMGQLGLFLAVSFSAAAPDALAQTCAHNNGTQECVSQSQVPIGLVPYNPPSCFVWLPGGDEGSIISAGIAALPCADPSFCAFDSVERLGSTEGTTLAPGYQPDWTRTIFRVRYKRGTPQDCNVDVHWDMGTYDSYTRQCPAGYEGIPNEAGAPMCTRIRTGCRDNNCVGNPISVSRGAKLQTVTDYHGEGGLSVVRHYASDGGNAPSPVLRHRPLGEAWRLNWDRKLTFWLHVVTNTTTIYLSRPGQIAQFFKRVGSGAVTKGLAAMREQLESLGGGGWKLTLEDETIEYYDSDGRLTSVVAPSGQVTTIGYDAQGRLETVTDFRGRAITFQYGTDGRVSGFVDPEQQTYAYQYLEVMTGVTYPDGRQVQYLYEKSGRPMLLTGVIDENGARHSTYDYDSNGNAISTELAGGVNKFTRSGNAITSPTGAVGTYSFATSAGERLMPG